MKLGYLGSSQVDAGPYRSGAGPGSTLVRLAPNLTRERVALDAELADPVRFREAISALHEVVVGDLRFRRRDKAAYQAWKQRQAEEEREVRAAASSSTQTEQLQALEAAGPPPADLKGRFRRARRRYWKARRRWMADLARTDPELWRHLVPCDPVVTVAPDAVLFEGFSKDASSYGCLVLDREGLVGGDADSALGTTNVDYSLDLYEHFQTLRSYRSTRLQVDPEGFEVRVEGRQDYREEKIDLPPAWLRGFGQISAATGLPSRRVTLSVEAVYSLLAFLGRHRERQGPRSVRFQLTPDRPPALIIDPWEVRLDPAGPAYQGERAEEVKVWGRRRLSVLARALPLADRIDVHLLGSGLPSLWVVSMAPLSLVVGLSGWTTNDWSSGANLELLADAWQVDDWTIDEVAGHLRRERSASSEAIARSIMAPRPALAAALHRLAERGQCVYDFSVGRWRWRSILPEPLGEAQLGPEPAELTKARELIARDAVEVTGRTARGDGGAEIGGVAGGTRCQVHLDADEVVTGGRCPCPFHRRFGVRKGPCRHLLALRLRSQYADDPLPPKEGP